MDIVTEFNDSQHERAELFRVGERHEALRFWIVCIGLEESGREPAKVTVTVNLQGVDIEKLRRVHGAVFLEGRKGSLDMNRTLGHDGRL